MKSFFCIYIISLFIRIFSEYTDYIIDTEITSVQPFFPVYQLLQKYQTIRVSADDGLILFNSADFSNDEVMHFKIKALNIPGNFYEEKASYEYVISSEDFIKSELINVSFSSKIDFETRDEGTRFRIRYFAITKKSNQFRNTNGNLLIIAFYVKEGVVEITNYEEEKGEKKLKSWEIALIVISVIIFIVIVIVIIIYAVRKYKKRKKRRNKYKSDYNNNEYVNDYNENISEYDDYPQEIRIYNRHKHSRKHDDYYHRNDHRNDNYDDNNIVNYKYYQKYDNNKYNHKYKENRYNRRYDNNKDNQQSDENLYNTKKVNNKYNQINNNKKYSQKNDKDKNIVNLVKNYQRETIKPNSKYDQSKSSQRRLQPNKKLFQSNKKN